MEQREKTGALCSDELIERLHQLIDGQRETILFRDRLTIILKRYERNQARFPKVTRKDRREQVTRLRDKAANLSHAISNLHDEVSLSIGTNLIELTYQKSREEIDTLSSKLELSIDDETLNNAKQSCERIKAACHIEIDLLDKSKGAKRGSQNPSMDQLIIDLAALYETETRHSAQSHCYRDDSSKERFNGKFFHLVKALLDEVAPANIGTTIALGKRINRVLNQH